MGAATIVENSLQSTFSGFWEQFTPKFLINIDLNKYSRSFVNFAILTGVISAFAGSSLLIKKTVKHLWKPTLAPAKQLQQKYGKKSWALITSLTHNHEYCKFLVSNGFNLLIIAADEEDVSIVVDMTAHLIQGTQIKIEHIFVDWASKENINYDYLIAELKPFDISIVVMPKLVVSSDLILTEAEQVPMYQHIYMLARYLAPKLIQRSYTSGMIFPSSEGLDTITPFNGVSKSIAAGIDGFGHILSYELKNRIEVVVARGSVQNAFIGLGKQIMTH